MNDPINPAHYKHLPVEAIEIIEAAIERAPTNAAAYHQGQVLKYLLRCWEKKGIEDLRKAKWYLDRMVDQFDETITEAIETPIAPPKRYRDPTKDDLANGPIKCEYRDFESEQWRSGLLVYILNGSCTFLCVSEERELSGQWLQCRIEAGE